MYGQQQQQQGQYNGQQYQQQQQQQQGYQAPSDYTGYTETVTLDDTGTGQGHRTIPLGAQAQSDLIEEILHNEPLRIPKAFYFFFYAAFGSLFPLMAIYFKQMGMNASQAGLLIGVRPFIEIFSAPFWSGLADKFRTGRIMLLASLFSWIVFTCSLSFIRPPASGCVIYNGTNHILYTPYSEETDENFERRLTQRGKRSNGDHSSNLVHPAVMVSQHRSMSGEATFNFLLEQEEMKQRSRKVVRQAPGGEDIDEETLLEQELGSSSTTSSTTERPRTFLADIDPAVRFMAPPGHIVGKSPTSIEYTLNYNKDKHAEYVSPAFCSVVYKWEDVKEVFFLLLLLVLLGEFFSAPAITLADQATLNMLADNNDLYGRQRMFGSLGWAVSMLLMGMILDFSTNFSNHPCLPHERERNYKVCFTVFAILMATALAFANKFQFSYEDMPMESQAQADIQMNPFDASKPRPWQNTAPPVNAPKPEERKFEFIDRWKSAVFAQRNREMPEWITVLKNFANLRYGAFLFVVWFMGLGIGLVFAFLFWHLQDLGGTPTLFGLASVLNHVSEIAAYLYSFKLIKELGHTRVLCIGLAGNVCRFLYVSWLDTAWMILPFELVQGITHAAVWAACCSYMTLATEPHMRSQTQAVLQGLHHGLGRGCGAIFGGWFINAFGSRVTFCLYGLMSAVVLGFFIFVNYQRTDKGYRWYEDDAGHQVVLEGDHLAPHGVPSAPINRTHSKTNLEAQNPFGAPPQQNYSTTDGYLNPMQGGGGAVGGGQSWQQPIHVTDSASLIPDGTNSARRAVLNPVTNSLKTNNSSCRSTMIKADVNSTARQQPLTVGY